MIVQIFDYGSGNRHSLQKALKLQGMQVRIGLSLTGIDALVLPGVGAFGAAAERLRERAVDVRRAVGDGLLVRGICLGMQLLLEWSEGGTGDGLGLIPGTVRRLRANRVRTQFHPEKSGPAGLRLPRSFLESAR